MKTKINLTSPEGRIIISVDEVVAVSETSVMGPKVKCQIWLKGIEEAWCISNDYDEVINLLD